MTEENKKTLKFNKPYVLKYARLIYNPDTKYRE